jgi:hypothetical protein
MQIEGGYLEGKKGLSNWDVFTHKQGEAWEFLFNLDIAPFFTCYNYFHLYAFVFVFPLFFSAVCVKSMLVARSACGALCV